MAVAALALVAGCAAVRSRSAEPVVPVGAEQVQLAAPSPAAVPAEQVDPAPAPASAAQRLVTSWLSIPSIGVHDLAVVAYVGSPDDAAGTVIEDRGVAASPRGASGGVGPGVVGNFVVTGHRTSASGPLRRLPQLRDGAHVLVRVGSTVYDYVVTGTLSVSFRSVSSKALQTAPVPGRPGVAAAQPMITLSTCATPEDHAAGDWWADSLGNPEHRIDKVGVLVAARPA
jgi:sortase A